jgi:hypothetical protein
VLAAGLIRDDLPADLAVARVGDSQPRRRRPRSRSGRAASAREYTAARRSHPCASDSATAARAAQRRLCSGARRSKKHQCVAPSSWLMLRTSSRRTAGRSPGFSSLRRNSVSSPRAGSRLSSGWGVGGTCTSSRGYLRRHVAYDVRRRLRRGAFFLGSRGDSLDHTVCPSFGGPEVSSQFTRTSGDASVRISPAATRRASPSCVHRPR